MGTNLNSDLVFLILQFLNENRLSETARKLEQESCCYFNMEYFESQVLTGEWDQADYYLSSFTTVKENSHSTKTFFEIRKQKYLEALDMKDYARAVEILRKDLKVFEQFNSDSHFLFSVLVLILKRNLVQCRENEQLSNYGDTISQRQLVFLDLQMFIKGNSQICNKLKFPHIDTSRLRILINQSLNWQHQHCRHPASIPDIRTLFFDHICAPPGGSRSHKNNSIAGVTHHCVPYFPVPTEAGVDLSGRCRLSLTGRMANSEPSIPHPPVSASSDNAFPLQNGGLQKQIRAPTANIAGSDYQFVTLVHVTKCSRIGPSVLKFFNTCSNLAPSAHNDFFDAKQSVREEDVNRIKKLCLANVSHPIHCNTFKLPGISKGKEIDQILYTNSGSSLLALDTNSCPKQWNWRCNEGNPTVKVTATSSIGLPLVSSSHSTTHDSYYKDPEFQNSRMVTSSDDEYIMSSSGRELSLHKSQTFELVSVVLPPYPPATSFALHPKDNNITAFGLENSKILIRHVKNGTSKYSEKILEGHHQKKITCLAFSLSLDLLISAGADGLICAWSLNEWDLQQEQFIYKHGERSSSPARISKIFFHKDQVHLLVVQNNQIVIHDCSTFDQACHWQTQGPMPAPILNARYSCDCQLVYTSFCDCAIGVFDADTLMPLFSIPPSAFLLSDMRRNDICPFAIAAHPHAYNQCAVGFTDGGVHLIELIESQGDEAVGSLKNGEGISDPSTSNHRS